MQREIDEVDKQHQEKMKQIARSKQRAKDRLETTNETVSPPDRFAF